MQTEIDFLFIHPPVSFDNKKIVLDADVAYTHQFVSIPVGIFNMSENLTYHGYKVKIANLGEELVRPTNTKTADMILFEWLKMYNPKIVGIDLHWWVHSSGALSTAQIVKKINPKIKTMVGGITSSYYAEEIVSKFNYIDFVLKGECDDAIVQFTAEILRDLPELSIINNLVYKNDSGIISNEVKIPEIDEKFNITRYDLLLKKPYVNADRAIIPITRGCCYSCSYCAASKESFKGIMKRESFKILKPKTVISIIKNNVSFGRKNIYLYGDIRNMGRKGLLEFFKLLNESYISNIHIVLEFFKPAPADYIQLWVDWAKRSNSTLEVTFSPDSGNYEVRKSAGRTYSNEEIIDFCKLLNSFTIPMSVYFLLGLPFETKETILETLKLSENIIQIFSNKFTKGDLRHEIIGYELMQIPDIGSQVFLNNEKFEINLDICQFSDIIELIDNSDHWSNLLGFSSQYLSKGDIIEEYYHIKNTINDLYYKYNVINRDIWINRREELEVDQNKSIVSTLI